MESNIENDTKFAVKYRPKTFDDFYGQSDIVNKLKFSIENNKVPNVMLITGDTGNGKTTLARIIAKAINKVDEISTLNDIIEINIGTNNTVECVDDIVKKINYRPNKVNHKKVYIFDEVHTLTKASASGLLKVLEEPSSYNIFILCTNEPGKMLETLKNRCYSINLKSYSSFDMIDLLKKVCSSENITDKVSNDILQLIAAQSNNSPREALNILQDVYFQIKSNSKINVESMLTKGDSLYCLSNNLLISMYNRKFSEAFDIIINNDCDALSNLMLSANRYLLNMFYKKLYKDDSIRSGVPYPYQLIFDAVSDHNYEEATMIHRLIIKSKENVFKNILLKDSFLAYIAKIC